MTLRVFSYGGGVQSNAVMVLQKRGMIHYDYFLFCNVGDDSENPATLDYVKNVARPYCEANGIPLVELQKVRRDGSPAPTLLETLEKSQRRIPIPVRFDGAGPGRRNCTMDYKIAVVAKWTREHGATKDNPAVVGLGISIDEWQRMADSRVKHQVNEYPLIELQMTREACARLIAQEGLPEPPKSSCWFCPFQSPARWRTMEADKPELFAKAVELERRLNEKRRQFGKDPVYLTRFMRPLDEAISGNVSLPFDEQTCESGYCMV